MVRDISDVELAPDTYDWHIQTAEHRARAGKRLTVAGLSLLLGQGSRMVFQGTPAGLAASGGAGDVGDNAQERGYTAWLSRRRARQGVA